jgi:hypothetical protein
LPHERAIHVRSLHAHHNIDGCFECERSHGRRNAVFNALAMKCFQLCFVTSVSSYAGTWVTTFGPR